MTGIQYTKKARAPRQEAAKARQDEHDKLTLEQKIEKAHNRRGGDSVREITRLKKLQLKQ